MPQDRPDADAERWLAALAARVEDDDALLASLSDADVAALLAQEDVRASGVAASLRRRLREAEAAAPRRRWRWAVGAAAVLALLAATWALWPSGTPGASDEVAVYRADLLALVGPPVKGEAPLSLASGAGDLLAAAEAAPPDTALARRAGLALAQAAGAEPTPERRAAAAFFAGLAYRLLGDPEASARWFRRVPPGSRYAADAAAFLSP